jgi:hypothetical protein
VVQPPGTVDPKLLVSGNLSTDPARPLGNAGSALKGSEIDARRMANYVVGPWEVDSSLVTPSPLRAMVLKDPAAVALIEPSEVATAVQAHDFINGFSSDRVGAGDSPGDSQGQERLMNAVLRFADPPSAAAAAADMAATTARVRQPAQQVSKVAIPAHPDAIASTYSYSVDAGDQHTIMVFSYTDHGPYVLCQTAQATRVDTAAALIAKTLDLQQPLIDKFSATDPAKFADLPIDPTGLLAHTVRYPRYPEPDDPTPTNPKVGVYEPRAALHFQDNPPGAAAAFSTAGVQAVSYYQTAVYKTRAAAAVQLAIDLANLVLTQPSTEAANGVDFMPASRCVQFDRPNGNSPSEYYCYAPADVFTIQAHDADPSGAHWQTAAQYKMLLAE